MKGTEGAGKRAHFSGLTIGIAGVGGIGSTVAQLLVRCGVRHLRLMDFDRVEESNLNRQFYFHDQQGRYKVEMLASNLGRIDPHVVLDTRCVRLDRHNMAGLLEGCDLVVEGADDRFLKKELVEVLAGGTVPVVSASGIAGTDLDTLRVKHFGNLIVVGDLVSDEADTPLFPPKVHMVAARMAGEVLKQLEKMSGAARAGA